MKKRTFDGRAAVGLVGGLEARPSSRDEAWRGEQPNGLGSRRRSLSATRSKLRLPVEIGEKGAAMKDNDAKWWNRAPQWLGEPRGPNSQRRAIKGGRGMSSGGAGNLPSGDDSSPERLRARINSTALAFRGYDVSNLGRSLELLDHPVYGPRVEELLEEGSQIASEALSKPIDLVQHVRANEPTSLDRFAFDVALIVTMELAQLQLLVEFFDFHSTRVKATFGYSIGELAALVLGGVFTLEQLLKVPLEMAADCADLAKGTHMGVLFTRGAALHAEDVHRLCLDVSAEGKGLIGPSAYLSPNTALLLGEDGTLDLFESRMRGVLPKGVNLRRNPNRWPPLHTPLVWKRNIPNRTAVMMHQTPGGREKPKPPVLSCVTGKASYNEWNSRELLTRWTDHPQCLWDVIHESMAMGVQTVVHVGPEPKLILATFTRLANNINKHLSNKYIHMLSHGVYSGMNRLAWLARILPSQTALLRAPFIDHVVLEDWLLKQPIAASGAVRVGGFTMVEIVNAANDTAAPNGNSGSLEPIGRVASESSLQEAAPDVQ